MGPLVGEMAEHIGDAIAQSMAQTLDHAAQAPAVRAEVVAVDQQGHGVAAAAAHVVAAGIDRAPQSQTDPRRAHHGPLG